MAEEPTQSTNPTEPQRYFEESEEEKRFREIEGDIAQVERRKERLQGFAYADENFQNFVGGIGPQLADAYYDTGEGHLGYDADKMAQTKSFYRNILNQRIEGLQREQSELSPKIREYHIGQIKKREGELTQNLMEQRGKFGEAVDKQLANMLEETGYQAGQARVQSGASLSGRGLLRSTAAENQLGEIGQAELQQKQTQRARADVQKSQAARFTRGVTEDIAARRRAAQASQGLEELRVAEDLVFNFDTQAAHQRFQEELQTMNIHAQDEAFFTEALGAIVGTGINLGAKAAAG